MVAAQGERPRLPPHTPGPVVKQRFKKLMELWTVENMAESEPLVRKAVAAQVRGSGSSGKSNL